MDASLVAEKVAEARDVVADSTVDCWITFCRETDTVHEPSLPYVLGFDVVDPTAVVVSADESAVVIGRHDAPSVEALGIHSVHVYDESIGDTLQEVLDRMSADVVAVNVDRDDPTADGLTQGMYLKLRDLLPDREFVHASEIVRTVRGVKSAVERERVERAAETTEELLVGMADAWDPAWSEKDVTKWLRARMCERNLESAWSREYCPTVHMGAAAAIGRTPAGERTLPEGELLHVRFGVKHEGYAADVQRLWVRGDPPTALNEAFEDVRAAIDAGRSALKPGTVGHEVDAAAREALKAVDRPPFDHAFGHQVGRTTRDGGTVLGPEWDRYGDAPYGKVRSGQVYAVGAGVDTDRGYVGQRELVRVTETGAEWMLAPQAELRQLE